MAEQATQVYELLTFDEVVKLCQNVIKLKEQAPASLRLTVAITAYRDVTYRGQGDAAGKLVEQVAKLIEQ